MATEFPTFVDLDEGTSPDPEIHTKVDADYLNSVNLAINTLENSMPGKADAGSLATVATSGAYDDLIGKPFIPSDPEDIGAQPAGDYADAEHEHTIADLDTTGTASSSTYLRGDGSWQNPTAGLHAVAFSGDYEDLDNTPDLGLDEEAVRDVIGETLVAGSNITLTPDNDTIIISASGGGGGGAVDSVNGQTGTVVLDAEDVGATLVTVDSDPVYTLDIDSSPVTAEDIGAVPDSEVGAANGIATLDANSRIPTSQMPRVPTTVRTVTYASSITINPAVDGNRVNITATGDITSLNLSTTGATDGQVIRVAVLASGAARDVTVNSAVRTSTGLTRGAHEIPSGEVWIGAFEYVGLVSGWVLTAYTISAS